MRRATGSVGVAALLLSCGSPSSDPPKPTVEQCLGGGTEDVLRRIDLAARQRGMATWPKRCGVDALYAGDRIAPAVLSALSQPALSAEPPPAPLALPGPGDALPAAFDDVVGNALHEGRHTCELRGDTLHCRGTLPGALVPRWTEGPPALRDGNKLSDAYTGAALTWGEQTSLGNGAYAIRDGMVFVDGVHGERAPAGALLVRDQVVWWDETSSQLMGKAIGGDAIAIGGMAKGASAPDAKQTCAGPEVAAVRLLVGGRIAVWASGTWQIYEAPGGPLWCLGKTVTTIAASGERQDCTAGGCPKVGGKVRAPAGAVVAPLGTGVIAAWVDDEVRVELPSHQQLIAFDGYKTQRSFHAQLRVDRVGIFALDAEHALLLLHGEKELAVKIGADGQLTALRVVVE